MTSRVFEEGLKGIASYFALAYEGKALASVWSQLKEFPDEAMAKAEARIFLDYVPTQRIALGQVAKIIREEGERLRQGQARQRELEWDQEKGVNPATSRVDGPVVTAKGEKGASVKALFSVCIGIVSGVSNQVTAQKLRKVCQDFPFMSRELDVTIRRYERG